MLQSLFSLIVLAEVSILGQTVWRQHTNIKWALIAHNLCRSLCSQCKSTAYSLRIPDHSKAFLAPYQRVPHNEECLKEIFNSGLKGLEFCFFHTDSYSSWIFSKVKEKLCVVCSCCCTFKMYLFWGNNMVSPSFKKLSQCHFPSTSVSSVCDVNVSLSLLRIHPEPAVT